MKIGFIGNTNNYPFMLALAFEKLGHSVIFIIDRDEVLHRPEFYTDTSKYSKIKIYDYAGVIKKFYHYIFFPRKVREIKNKFHSCDLLIVNGLWPIFARKINKPYITLLTGSDLDQYANWKAMLKKHWSESKRSNLFKRLMRSLLVMYIARTQFLAIKKSNAFNYFAKGIMPHGDEILEKMGKDVKRLSFMMTDIDKRKLVEARETDTLRILLVARHTWVLPIRDGMSKLDYKGTDIFLKGIALYKEKSNLKIEVILVEKGPDVGASKHLVKKLGISDLIVWKKEMSQSDLFKEYKNSDIIADQFSDSVVGMGGLDAMAMGKPLLANGRPEIIENATGAKSPICQCKTPEEICEWLLILESYRERSNIGSASRIYVERYFSSKKAAEECLKIFQKSRAKK